MSLGWIIYYGLGFFFAAGVLTTLLSFADEIKARVGYEGTTQQVWVWVAIGVAGGFIPFWAPIFIFALCVVFWLGVIRTFKKVVKVDLKALTPTEPEN